MNRSLQSFLAILLVLVVGFGSWRWIVASEEPPPSAPPRDLGPIPVLLDEVRPRELVVEVEAYGNLVPRRRVDLVSEVAGRIVEVHPGWRPGASVEEGELLLRVDPGLYRLDVRTAEAVLAERSADVDAARVQERRTERVLASARDTLEVAIRQHERLVELGAVAAEALRDQALRVRLQAELALQTAESDREAARAALETARAREATAVASVERARALLERTELRAPFRGRLRGRAPGPGTLAAPGVVLAELVDDERLLLQLRVPERDLLLLREGLPARVTFPATPETDAGGTLGGRVVAVDAEADPATRRGLVEVELPNRLPEAVALVAGLAPPGAQPGDGVDATAGVEGAPRMPAGLFARAVIEARRLPDALWIDRRHLRWEEGRPVAYVLPAEPEEGGVARAVRRQLVLLREHGEGFVVGDGLRPGERLILHPLDRLTDGASVRPRRAPVGGPAERAPETGPGR